MTKAVALFSGGLDSILAVKLVEEQGIRVIPLHIYTWFAGNKSREFLERSRELFGIDPVVLDMQREFFSEVLFSPKHGYGQGMNPCIDCKVFFLKVAKSFMEKEGASFVVTGDVVGQRPMSQKRETLKLIEKEAGLDGLVLRPLSARLLEPTMPEKAGLINRDALEGIQGRGRKRQLELARRFGLKEIPSPAGGCLLTDPTFSKRLKALIEVKKRPKLQEVKLLRLGRILKLNGCILIVARNEREANALPPEELWATEDRGVSGVCVGNCAGLERVIGGILLRYAKKRSGAVITPSGKKVLCTALPPEEVHPLIVA